MNTSLAALGLVESSIQGVRKHLRSRRESRHLLKWERAGRPAPPPHQVKQAIVREYARKFGLSVLVETGTFLGDMVEAMRNDFERIHSIELSVEYYQNARQRFQGYPHVELIHGDSGQELGKLLTRLDKPALFWLDGHYSAGSTARGASDTPVMEELDHIIRSANTIDGHVVLIDDARCFGANQGYPAIEDLQAHLRGKRAEFDFAVEDDVVRITSLTLVA